jgi:NADP-dependent aldehyde dehydrogenase
LAHQSALDVGLHPASLQLLYHVPQEVGFEMVSHPLVGATAFTGSGFAGLRLKERADRAGKPIYLEMSSINPVVMLPGALSAKADLLAEEFSTSCLMGAGQFCTNPGLIFVQAAPAANRFLGKATERFESTPTGVILGKSNLDGLGSAIRTMTQHGAKILTGGNPVAGTAYRFENTLLQVDGAAFLESPEELQTEAFGPVSLVVIADNLPQLKGALGALGGNLTGSIYSSTDGSDENAYQEIEPILRRKVGRLLNDKMPTGVAVSPAMNHGGPFPATGHPGFTAVGLPYSIQCFAALYCYDNCRSDHLPPELRDENPLGVDQQVKAD